MNPRGIRYLPEETFLLIVYPGPKEPNLTQMNKIHRLFVNSMLKLYNGRSLTRHPFGISNFVNRHGV